MKTLLHTPEIFLHTDWIFLHTILIFLHTEKIFSSTFPDALKPLKNKAFRDFKNISLENFGCVF